MTCANACAKLNHKEYPITFSCLLMRGTSENSATQRLRPAMPMQNDMFDREGPLLSAVEETIKQSLVEIFEGFLEDFSVSDVTVARPPCPDPCRGRGTRIDAGTPDIFSGDGNPLHRIPTLLRDGWKRATSAISRAGSSPSNRLAYARCRRPSRNARLAISTHIDPPT